MISISSFKSSRWNIQFHESRFSYSTLIVKEKKSYRCFTALERHLEHEKWNSERFRGRMRSRLDRQTIRDRISEDTMYVTITVLLGDIGASGWRMTASS